MIRRDGKGIGVRPSNTSNADVCADWRISPNRGLRSEAASPRKKQRCVKPAPRTWRRPLVRRRQSG